MRNPKELGERKYVRIKWHKPGFVFPAPRAPSVECLVLDVSNGGVCIDVDALPLPNIFGISFDDSRHVVRVCSIVWRRGEFVGARFMSAKDLRDIDPGAEAQENRNIRKSVAARLGLLSL